MALTRYNAKRNFEITPEPAGSETTHKQAEALSFVVQKHAASRLHYDFRLEWNGVLVSWAVPKGPSLDPATKRLAMAVEDHPLEYGGFEGIIPEGEYGGGTVMVWDRGAWEPEGTDDVDAALKKGELKFALHGKKLRGSWVLVRTKGRGNSEASWLLIKHRDRYSTTEDIAATKSRSVLSRRSMSGIAKAHGGNVEKAAKADAAPESAKS